MKKRTPKDKILVHWLSLGSYTNRKRKVHKRDNYLCQICGLYLEHGQRTLDHIEPHRMDREKFLDMNNMRTLCRKCHDKKNAEEGNGSL